MKNKIYILFFIIGLSYTSCKKFPEDKSISLNTVKDRLTGNWKFESIIFNGQDVTAKYNDSIVQPLILNDIILSFSFNRKSSLSANSKVNDLVDNHGYINLHFEIDKKKISFKNVVDRFFNKLFLNSEFFIIRRLYKGKLKIKNDNYEITLNKISN
ncbi:MAG: hypothetical protein JNJ41_15150 [Bacteroidia bacterium]|nr:hypothetical protein [Bacteroidia bacterium]